MYQFLGAARSQDRIVALATGEGVVRTWSLDPPSLHAEFETTFGGVLGRLALGGTSDRIVVATAAFGRGVVSGYDALTGNRLWERSDVREAWHLAPASGGRHFMVAFGRGPMQVLDGLTGEPVAQVRGVRAVSAGSDPELAIATFDDRFVLARVDPWEVISPLDVTGFGVLDVEFASNAILVSVVQDPDVGASSVFGLSRAAEILWWHECAEARNVPWLGRDLQLRQWLGIEHDPNRFTPPLLIRWNDDGEVLSELTIPEAADFAFVLSGSQLIGTPGVVIDTATGFAIGRLDAS